MAEKILQHKKKPIASAKAPREAVTGIVLVATYREKQLAWIEKNGVYNYPVKDGDEFDAASFAKIKELWLYADAKGTRHCFAAEFVGKKTREEFLAENPTYANLGRAGAPRTPDSSSRGRGTRPACPHASAYYVFKTTPLEYGPRLENPIVLARAADFGGRSAKVRKAVEQFKADGEFASLADYLPTELKQVPRPQLRVCEAAVQLDFSVWSPVVGMTPVQEKIASIVMSVADFGRQHKISTADAYVYLSKYEGLTFLDEHYSMSRCYSEEMMTESLDKVCRNHGGVLA